MSHITAPHDTIVALATPQGKSGVAILRISGKDALTMARHLGARNPLTPRYAHYVTLKRPDSGAIIDHVLLLYFKAPHSFTGEDVLEIHCHGGKAIIHELTTLLLAHPSIRYAQAGEFSRRALLNNKMDYVQAESLIDLIDAETIQQKAMALRNYSGELSKNFSSLQQEMIQARAFCEAFIDFPDEDLPDTMDAQINAHIERVIIRINELLNSYEHGRQLREGLQVAIVGIPNAGKSTLINSLAQSDVAIVSDIEGTTRDVIEYYKDIQGIPFRFFDTAGVRHDSDDPLEHIGIELAIRKAKSADLILAVLDATKALPPQIKILSDIVSRETIWVVNKMDLVGESDVSDLREQICVSHETIFCSAMEQNGAQTLLKLLSDKRENYQSNDLVINRERHRSHLDAALLYLKSAYKEKELVLKSQHLIDSTTEIGHIVGSIHIETILDNLFSSFCIGK